MIDNIEEITENFIDEKVYKINNNFKNINFQEKSLKFIKTQKDPFKKNIIIWFISDVWDYLSFFLHTIISIILTWNKKFYDNRQNKSFFI